MMIYSFFHSFKIQFSKSEDLNSNSRLRRKRFLKRIRYAFSRVHGELNTVVPNNFKLACYADHQLIGDVLLVGCHVFSAAVVGENDCLVGEMLHMGEDHCPGLF